MAAFQISQLDIKPGHRVCLNNVNWGQFKDVLGDLCDRRATKIAYSNGNLEIMVSQPEHEENKEIISDLLKALLEELNLEFRALGSTTFEQQATLKAIQPDQCFYIQNEATIRGKRRLSLNVDPPPDLAIEIDVASRTHLEIYQALGVSEVWQFKRDRLTMHKLWQGKYVEVKESPIFPNLPLKELIPYCLEQSRTLGRNVVIRDFRLWVKDKIKAQ